MSWDCACLLVQDCACIFLQELNLLIYLTFAVSEGLESNFAGMKKKKKKQVCSKAFASLMIDISNFC